MTTLGDLGITGGEPAESSEPAESEAVAATTRRRVWPRVIAGFVVGFLLCLGLAGGALLGYDAAYDRRVLVGVSVGDMDLSGLDRDQASAALDVAFGTYSSGRVVVRTAAGQVGVPYQAFARRPDVAALVDEAMRAGRVGTPLERAVSLVRLAASPTSIAPRVTLDEAALERAITAAVTRFDRVPVDSTVAMSPMGIVISMSRAGVVVDATDAVADAVVALRRIDTPDKVVVDAAMTAVPPRHGDAEALAARDAAERMIHDIVVKRGTKKWRIKAATVRKWIRIDVAADGSPWPVADPAKIPASLKKIRKAVHRAPVSAAYLKTRQGRVVGVAPATDGRRLDAPATATAIAKVLADRAGGATTKTVKVHLKKVAPKRSTAEALKKGPLMTRLGSWRTWFPISERNYFGANIWLPAKIIDGTVLFPGQRFEWWGALGPVSPSRGYGPGGFIAGNHTEPTGALGGGMCSSSTTLFNAALRAGLQMGARRNHRYYISRYPLGLDATVSKTPGGGVQTVSFKNDMKKPIVIRTFRYRAGGVGWVRYEIWGIPDGRKVSLSRPSVSNRRNATTRTIYDSSMPKGAKEQTEYPADGMDVSVTRVVRNARGKVIHRDTYRTHYALWNGIIKIGR